MQGITRIEKRTDPRSSRWLADLPEQFVELWFCDRVEWTESGGMVTGPAVYARLADGSWVKDRSYILLCRTGGTPCEPPDGEIDADAVNRMQAHFTRLGLPNSAASI